MSIESIANWATIISCVLEVILFGLMLWEFKYLRYEAKSSYDFEMEQKIEYLCYTVNEHLKKEIGKLAVDAKIYDIIDDDFIKKLEIRKIIVDNYIVFYRIKNKTIEIVRIMYGRRNWIALL